MGSALDCACFEAIVLLLEARRQIPNHSCNFRGSPLQNALLKYKLFQKVLDALVDKSSFCWGYESVKFTS